MSSSSFSRDFYRRPVHIAPVEEHTLRPHCTTFSDNGKTTATCVIDSSSYGRDDAHMTQRPLSGVCFAVSIIITALIIWLLVRCFWPKERPAVAVMSCGAAEQRPPGGVPPLEGAANAKMLIPLHDHIQVSHVLAGSGAAIVLVYAPWCPHCTTFLPKMQEFASRCTTPGLQYYTINGDDAAMKDVVRELGVSAFPHCIGKQQAQRGGKMIKMDPAGPDQVMAALQSLRTSL